MDDGVVKLLDTVEIKRPGRHHLRRNATEHFNPSIIGEKALPHFLRASARSCHDFCKHGKQQDTETKRQEPLRRTNSTPPLGGRGCVMIERPVSAEVQRGTSFKLKPLGNSRRASLESSPKALQSDVISAASSFGVCFNEASANAKDAGGAMKSGIISKPKPVKQKHSGASAGGPPRAVETIGGISSVGIDGQLNSLRNKNYCKIWPVTSQSPSSQHPAEGVNDSTNGIVKETKQTRRTIALVAVQKTPLPPMAPLSPIRSVISLPSHNDQKLGVLPDREIKKKVEDNAPEYEAVSEETLYVIKVEAENQNRSTVSASSGAVSMSEGNSTLSSDTSLSLSSPKSLDSQIFPSVPPLVAENSKEFGCAACQENNCILENAGIVANKDETENFENAEKKSMLRNSAPGEEKNCIMENSVVLNETETQEVLVHKSKLRKSVIVSSNVDGDGDMKLKFRKGRVVDLEAQDETQPRLFRKQEIDDNVNERADGAENIALKHQDVQSCKGAGGLLNNVIEETAFRLAKTNKSKVKALVGAFETVISLQDRKPSRASIG